MAERSFLFVVRKSPYEGTGWREAMDTLLATSAFGQTVTLLLMGDGVLQLLKNQQPDRIAARSPLKHLASFSLYDIEQVYVQDAALARLGLTPAALTTEPAIISATDEDIQHLIQRHDICLSF